MMKQEKSRLLFVVHCCVVTLFMSSVASAASKTITVPEDTEVIEVDSTYCEPIYNEDTGTLYVPRCWKLEQESEQDYFDRTVDRSIEQLGTEVENSINNGIDRQIDKVGKKIDEVTGVR